MNAASDSNNSANDYVLTVSILEFFLPCFMVNFNTLKLLTFIYIEVGDSILNVFIKAKQYLFYCR